MIAAIVPAYASTVGAMPDPGGTDHLERVAELRFTFVVERDGQVAAERAWSWRPNEGAATRRAPGDPIAFHAFHPENDVAREADAQFVNDGFWLLPHLHLRWAGESVTVEDRGEQRVPVGEGTAEMLVATWPSEGGGYTPGDRYDLFVRDGAIVAWSFHRGGADEPTLSTTFEAPVHLGPLTLATDHRDADGKLRIRFTDLGITLAPGVSTLALLDGDAAREPLVEVWDQGCRIRGIDVPLGGLPAPEPPAAVEGPFGVRLEVRTGDHRDVVGVSAGLGVQDPGVITASGFQRCELRAADDTLLERLLDGASAEERTALLALALQTWGPRSGPAAGRVQAAAATCAADGACDEIRGYLNR
ncbi:MAG: hypothetical protein KC621_31020 [Myxococcales bacterium]|nr:hypothetical protein [Myxococcales bacterium]